MSDASVGRFQMPNASGKEMAVGIIGTGRSLGDNRGAAGDLPSSRSNMPQPMLRSHVKQTQSNPNTERKQQESNRSGTGDVYRGPHTTASALSPTLAARLSQDLSNAISGNILNQPSSTAPRSQDSRQSHVDVPLQPPSAHTKRSTLPSSNQR